MTYASARRLLPRWVVRQVYYFETRVEEAVQGLAGSLEAGLRVLDAGAGECRYAPLFARQRYTAVDMAVGDAAWDYSRLHAVADLAALPFADGTFDCALNIVTLEHLTDPGVALREIARTLRPGGRLLIAAPMEWEVHQEPHDYFRYTEYGLRLLARRAGLDVTRLEPVGGLYRLLARRLLFGVKLAPWWAAVLLAPALLPLALVLPAFEATGRGRHFTLGYICIAQKPS